MMPSDRQQTSDERIVVWAVIFCCAVVIVLGVRSCDRTPNTYQYDHEATQRRLAIEVEDARRESDKASRAFHESLRKLK